MALKFVFSIVVLMNLNISVSGRSNVVSGTRYATYYCMDFVQEYPNIAEGFADKDAKKKDLDVAIDYITNAEKKDMKYDLTECYKNREVKSF